MVRSGAPGAIARVARVAGAVCATLGRMRIGVVSCTHDKLANVARIVDLFNRAAVERVVHTGDITRPATLEVLAELHAPVWAVYGNNDVERESLASTAERLGVCLADPPLRLGWCGRLVSVVHDPHDITPTLRQESDVVLHGHNHRKVIEREDGLLIFNPGECAGLLEGRNAVGVLDLKSLATELLLF